MEKKEEEAAEVKESSKTTTSSLFPLLRYQSPSEPNNNCNSAPQWLHNPSFTTDLSLINDAVSSHYDHQSQPLEYEEEEEEKEDHHAPEQRRPSYDLLDSSLSDDDDDDKKGDRKKKRRKHKRTRSREAATSYDYALPSSRKPDVGSWAASSSATKDYFFDSRGDRDNLAFGCLYKMDVARYKLYNSREMSELNYYRVLYGWKQRSRFLDGEGDNDVLDSKLKSVGRYWSARYAALERHKNLKRIRIIGPEKPKLSIGDPEFIPVSGSSDGGSFSRASVVEESWEDELLRKTREFNKMTRERPHDQKVWLDFAEFQDKVARMQSPKGARLQSIEKKISILEKANELNPASEELLLALMNAYQSRDSTDVLIGRWEKILMQNSGCYQLWREFLCVVRGEFSRFKVSEMRKMYANAIQALSAARTKQYRQANHTAITSSLDPVIIQQELGLVDIFLSLCRFEWQAGYQELATALLQAEIEYSLFCPSLLLTEQSKLRLFEHFWNSSDPRVGEDGALGWSTWLEKEEEQRHTAIISEESLCKVEEGGWTGWSEQLSRSKEIGENPEHIADNDLAVEDYDESVKKDIEEKEDTEDLLKMLGIDVDAASDVEIKDTKTLTRWSEEELSRDSDQWMPVRAKSAGNSHSDGIADRECDEQLLRVILFEDVCEFLFSISSKEARLSLVFQFIDFYGGRIAQWACTNSSSWAEKTLSLEALQDSFLDDLRRVHDVLTKTQTSLSSFNLEVLLSSSDDISMRANKMKFVRNAILLCLTASPCNYLLEEAALVAEELSNTRMGSCSCSVTPCRALAKSLLKSNRQDILLCGVYARREAVFGNIDNARKVFDMALLSIEGHSLDSRLDASLLYFWYAEVELANSSDGGSESTSRAMHILSCLGSGIKYSPFKCQPSSLQQLRARQGYKECMTVVWSTWARGVTDDCSTAFICSAALFEELTTGWASSNEILNQAFSMVLPERRSQSLQLEFLFNYYVRMLWRHHGQSNLAKLWVSVVQGLQIYPFSPKLYNSLVEISHLHTGPSKLRWIFDDYCHKKPSVIVWLFALSFEMNRGGSQHRIRGLFERAFANNGLRNSVVLWRCYIAYEITVACNPSAARRIFFRAIHACPWSKKLWLDGFVKLSSVLTAKELLDLHEVMRDKELNLRTDIYEILLQDEVVS